jgi:hypothetical protein
MFDTFMFWLITILISNIILIVIFWNIYGKRIEILIARKDEKKQILDQLRREALELKLPKEHSPRI